MRRRPVPRVLSGGLAVGLGAIGVVLAGCVSLPSGGRITQVTSLPNSDPGNQLVITPRKPGPQWGPTEIVSGFLVASGANPSDPSDLSIARDYLTTGYSKVWRARGRAASTSPDIIDTTYTVEPNVGPPGRVTGGQNQAQVTVTSDHLQTLVAAGTHAAARLQVAPGPAPYPFKFELLQVAGGQWRINGIIANGQSSASVLLLTDSDFDRNYLARNLYYLARGSSQTLVPYPVYIPAQTGQLGVVKQLLNAVRTTPPAPSNWLYHAITTAFPKHTKLSAQIQGGDAVVTLSGSGAAGIDPQTLSQIRAQLAWTLTYTPDSPGTGVSLVQLNIGPSFGPYQLWRDFQSWVPQGSSGPLYFQTLNGAGRPLLEQFTPSSDFGSPNAGPTAKGHGAAGTSPKPAALPSELGNGPFTTIAISPAPPKGVNIFAGCRGKVVYVAQLLAPSDLSTADLPGNCTSLSWDDQGDLWAVAGSDVWVITQTITGLRVSQGSPIPVSIPVQGIPDNVVSLKVAPDGLRVAMIVRTKNGANVYISAITGTKNGVNVNISGIADKSSIVYLAQGGPVLTVGPDLVSPVGLTWLDADHLLVLERPRGAPSQLYDVPVNGGESTKVFTPANADSVTANGQYIAVGTPGSGGSGQPALQVSRGLNGPWLPIPAGSTPAYQG